MTDIERLTNRQTEINELIMSVRKATGDAINDMLPEKLRSYGYRVLNLNDGVLMLYCKENDVMEQAIIIRHMFGKDDGVFRMFIDKPQYFSRIDLLKDTDAMVFIEVLTEILTNRKFQTELSEKLKEYDLQMREFRQDILEIEKQIKEQ